MKTTSTLTIGDVAMPLLAMITLTGMSGSTKDITKRFNCEDTMELYMCSLEEKNIRGVVTHTSIYIESGSRKREKRSM